MSVFEKLCNIIYVYADHDKTDITAETNLLTEVGLNSFEFAQILYEIEVEFGLGDDVLEVGLKQIKTMQSLVDLVEASI